MEKKDASTMTSFGGEGVTSGAHKVQVYATEEQLRSVFSNRVISHNVMSYLNFGDMKVGRQVSRIFLEMIETCKRFKDAQVLLMTKENISPLSDHDFHLGSDRIWRGVKIDVCLPRNDLWKIPRHIIENVEFVSLVSTGDFIEDDLDALRRGPSSTCLSARDVLMSTTKISHLQFDVRLFERSLRSVVCAAGVKENLRNLKRLDIIGIGHDNCARSSTGNNGRTYEVDLLQLPKKDRYSFVNNLNLLTKILHCLESLRLPKVSFYKRHPRRLQRAVVELLQGNQETLKELAAHLDVWEMNDIRAVRLPHLKSLTATVSKTGQESLKEFLGNHVYLEELDIAVQKDFGRDLFDVIKTRSANLTKLHLNAKKLVDLIGGREESVDWSFLERMIRLKDFQICRPLCNNARWDKFGNGPRILESLHPRRNQLERLSFRGIGAKDCGFWNRNFFGFDVLMVVELPLHDKLELLHGFTNLKCLSFNRCPDAVDDNVMQLILTEMTSLEEFEVSHCSRLTDAGLAGTGQGEGRVSIRNLTGLKQLSIRLCPLVTPSGILSCLQLPYLRRLEYLAQTRVSQSFVSKIVSKNPSLESVAVNFHGPRSKLLKIICRNNPRVTTLIDPSNYDSEDGDYDSDSDADDNSEDEEMFEEVVVGHFD